MGLSMFRRVFMFIEIIDNRRDAQTIGGFAVTITGRERNIEYEGKNYERIGLKSSSLKISPGVKFCLSGARALRLALKMRCIGKDNITTRVILPGAYEDIKKRFALDNMSFDGCNVALSFS